MTQKFLKIAQDLVVKAIKAGADTAEIYIQDSRDMSVEIVNGQIETMKNAHAKGLGIRIIKDDGMGYAFSSDFSFTVLDRAVNQAITNASIVAKDPFVNLKKKQHTYKMLDLYDMEIVETSIDKKINLAKEIENAALAEDKRIKIIENCTYQDSIYSITLVNSLGIEASNQGAYCGAYAFLVAEEDGDNQTGFDFQYGLKYSNLDPVQIGKNAAKKAVRMLKADSITTQTASLVLDPYVASNFLGVLSAALSAEAVQKGRSVFAKKIGDKVASAKVTIIDDGIMSDGVASAPFDSEGTPCQKTVLINKGILSKYLHNNYTAAKDKVESTGNGMRSSYKSTPEVGTTNFYLCKGNVSEAELIKGVDNGLYVTEVMGMHTANPISGDFSVGAAGIWIENGEFKNPVRGVAIAGNILDLLDSIDEVADDLRFFAGNGAPTVRVNEIAISGS